VCILVSEIDLNQMNNMQYDVFREIGNIGAGNATTALSQMINAKIDMKVPSVQLLEFKDLPDLIGGAENIVVGILFTLHGQIDGMMMFMMEKPAARHLVNLLVTGNNSSNSDDFNDMERSALNEIGNICLLIWQGRY
jgi:chemotaxis protein CheC